MALLDTVTSGVKNQLTKTKDKIFNLVSGNNSNLYGTIEGSNWNAEAKLHDGQKRFQTKSTIPNYPKVSGLTYVYFNINPATSSMIAKKRNTIQQWSKKLYNLYNPPSKEEKGFLSRKVQGYSNIISDGFNSANKFMNKLEKDVLKKEYSLTDGIQNALNKSESILKKGNNYIQDIAKKGDSYIKSATNFLNKHVDKNIVETLDYIESAEDLTKLSKELSKFVKSVSRPKIRLNTTSYNQYNRKRLVYKNVEYQGIKISFHDVKNSPMQRFFLSYLKCINDSFLMKGKKSYTNNSLLDKYNDYYEEWGFNTDSDFMLIDRITVLEWLNDKITVYNYNNPKITEISMSDSTLGDFNPQEFTVSFEYEGLTTDLYDIPELESLTNNNNLKGYQKYVVGKQIVEEIANLIQMNFTGASNFYGDLATSFIKGVLNNKSGSKWDIAKMQGLETLRKLGFGEQMDFVDTLINDIDNVKDGDTRVIFNTLDSPAGTVGVLVNSDKNTFGELPISN